MRNLQAMRKFIFRRGLHFISLSREGILGKWLGPIWLILGIWIVFRDDFWMPANENKWRIINMIPHISLAWWLVGALVIVIIWIFEASFQITAKRDTKISELSAVLTGKPLKRMIAYSRLDLIVPWNGKAPQFHGYNVGVRNVSDDTITARIIFLNADVDGAQAMANTTSSPTIIPQTQGTIFLCRQTQDGDTPISTDAKTITVEFEVDYDTIPESGVRRSYKKITYPLNWANGKNSPPLLEPQPVDEWER